MRLWFDIGFGLPPQPDFSSIDYEVTTDHKCDIFLESPGYKEPYGNAMGQIPMSNQNHLIFLEQGVGESKAVGVERGIYCD